MTRWVQGSGLLGLAAAGLTACLGGGGPALAAEVDPVALLWNAPGGCPAADAVHDQVEKTLGLAPADLAPVAAVVTVSRGVGRWQANMTLHAHGERTEREYEAESCDALAAATTLIVALAAEGREHEAPTGTGPPSSLRRDGDRAAQGSEPTWTGSTYVLQFAALIDRGTMPDAPRPAVEADVARRWSAAIWRLRLSGGTTFFLPADAATVGYPGVGRYWALDLTARGCATAALGAFELGPCVGAELVAMHGSHIAGTGTSSTQLWVSPVASVVVGVAISPRAVLFARADAAIPDTRRTFWGSNAVGSVSEEHTVAAFALRGVAGAELRFY